MTAVLEGGEWSAARLGRTLNSGKTRYPFYRRLGGPLGRSGRAENLIPTGIRSRTIQPVVSCYTDWAPRPTTSKNKHTIISTRTCEYFSHIAEFTRPLKKQMRFTQRIINWNTSVTGNEQLSVCLYPVTPPRKPKSYSSVTNAIYRVAKYFTHKL